MHEHHIAHRFVYKFVYHLHDQLTTRLSDCMTLNIMLDPHEMYPQLYHFVATHSTRDNRKDASYYSRTRRPPKYYWTDFGLSRQYDPDNVNPLEEPIIGGDRTVPEFQEDPSIFRNPFHTDVYYLGNLIREDFLQASMFPLGVSAHRSDSSQQYSNLGFMTPLIASMVKKDPDQRPTMEQAMRDLERIVSQLPWWKLRARLRRRKDDWSLDLVKDVQHIFRTAFYLVLFLPAVPIPRSTSDQVESKRSRLSGACRTLAYRLKSLRKQPSPSPPDDPN